MPISSPMTIVDFNMLLQIMHIIVYNIIAHIRRYSTQIFGKRFVLIIKKIQNGFMSI